MSYYDTRCPRCGHGEALVTQQLATNSVTTSRIPCVECLRIEAGIRAMLPEFVCAVKAALKEDAK